MARRSMKSLIVTALFIFLSQLCLVSAYAGKGVKLLYADQANETSMIHELGVMFHEKVENYSGENIQFKKRLGGVLGDYMVLAEQTSMGAIDMSMIWSPSDLDPKLDVAWLGWMVKDLGEAKQLFGPEGPMFAIFDDLFAGAGMKLLMMGSDGISGLHIRKGTNLMDKINSFPEDAKGIKARIPSSKMYEKRARNLGFSPVAIPYSEVYTGLQLGTFDARFCTEPSELMAFGDVLEGWIGINELAEPIYLVMNLDKWNSLSEDNQQILEKAAKEVANYNWEYLPEYTRKWEEKAKAKYGIKIKHLPKSELVKLQTIAREEEWPFGEELFGKELMGRVYEARKQAGLE